MNNVNLLFNKRVQYFCGDKINKILLLLFYKYLNSDSNFCNKTSNTDFLDNQTSNSVTGCKTMLNRNANYRTQKKHLIL